MPARRLLGTTVLAILTVFLVNATQTTTVGAQCPLSWQTVLWPQDYGCLPTPTESLNTDAPVVSAVPPPAPPGQVVRIETTGDNDSGDNDSRDNDSGDNNSGDNDSSDNSSGDNDSGDNSSGDNGSNDNAGNDNSR